MRRLFYRWLFKFGALFYGVAGFAGFAHGDGLRAIVALVGCSACWMLTELAAEKLKDGEEGE